jgi:hypothetical protein
MTNTKLLADKVVHALETKLSANELLSFKSIYITGSYCRGDWLNCSSDLDIHMIINNNGIEYKEMDFEYVQSIVVDVLDNHPFPSHCPGGIDYGFSSIDNIPKTTKEACIPSPYAPFSALMFDFRQHNLTVYGENVNELLPEAPDPKTCVKEWFDMLASRIQNTNPDNIKLAFNTLKAITAAQIYFGEKTVNKYKILELYQRYVPYFSTKYFGEMVIRNYIGSIYPNRTPISFQHSEYLSFINDLANVMTVGM